MTAAALSRPARGIGAILALTAVAGLALQLIMFFGLLGPWLGGWRWIGFFTVWSNLLAVGVGAAVALGARRSQRAELVLLTALAGVGLVYSLLLRATWNEQGLQQLVGIMLHDITPLLAAGLWAVGPHGRLSGRDVLAAIGFPAGFLIVAELRGAVDGWYPYAFLDPAQGAAALALSLGATVTVFALIAAALTALDRRLGGQATASATT